MLESSEDGYEYGQDHPWCTDPDHPLCPPSERGGGGVTESERVKDNDGDDKGGEVPQEHGHDDRVDVDDSCPWGGFGEPAREGCS